MAIRDAPDPAAMNVQLQICLTTGLSEWMSDDSIGCCRNLCCHVRQMHVGRQELLGLL